MIASPFRGRRVGLKQKSPPIGLGEPFVIIHPYLCPISRLIFLILSGSFLKDDK